MKRQTIPKSLDGIRRKTDGTHLIARPASAAKPRDFNFYSIAAARTTSSSRISRTRTQRKNPST